MVLRHTLAPESGSPYSPGLISTFRLPSHRTGDGLARHGSDRPSLNGSALAQSPGGLHILALRLCAASRSEASVSLGRPELVDMVLNSRWLTRWRGRRKRDKGGLGD